MENSKVGESSKPKGRRRFSAKGRKVDRQAQKEVRSLISNLPQRRDLLIEYLHCIQDFYGHLAARHLVALAEELGLAPVEVYEVATFYHHFDVVDDGESPPPATTLRVCDSITCEMFGAESLISQLRTEYDPEIRIQRVPCVGRCEHAPVAVYGKKPIHNANALSVATIIKKGQTDIDPINTWISLNTYEKNGGYSIVRKCRDGSIRHEAIVDALQASELRGLGGAGFPAGRKWNILRQQSAPRILAVNIDEGEPGTFKDRYYLEKDPHRFLEGVMIATEVVGIDSIYIYVRDEYPSVLEILRKSIEELREKYSVFVEKIELRRGAGAYICGEESAMIESIEGKRGMPRLRPPYVAEVGLFGRPTLEHNCETLYWVRDIVDRGSDWFAKQGRRGRKGLRSFSVSGRIKNPGVYLAPAGISLRELIDEYCEGMLEGHELYAYFPGGASGGILPESLADEPLDFDTLQDHGCFIGSAAIIVLSDQDLARDTARNAIKFFAHESCGQCTPCRVGSDRAARLMNEDEWDKTALEDLCVVMEDASICGLGQAAPNPIRCAIKYFPNEVGIK